MNDNMNRAWIGIFGADIFLLILQTFFKPSPHYQNLFC